MSKKRDTHETEAAMTRASKKMLATIITAVFTAGAAAGYFVPPVVGNGEGVRELRIEHRADIDGIRAALDQLRVSASKSEAKLDLIVQMVQDHTRSDK